jgi:hypothetical protein
MHQQLLQIWSNAEIAAKALAAAAEIEQCKIRR